MKSILARPDEVRAFIAGKKTMLRRPIKMRNIDFIGGRGQENDPECWGYFFDGPSGHGYMVLAQGLNEHHNGGMRSINLPYAPGDTVAVKETWRIRGKHTDGYDADTVALNRGHFEIAYQASITWNDSIYGKQRAPRTMPISLCRLHLLVTAVKIERLQSISEAEATAEGASFGWELDAHFSEVGAYAYTWDSHAKPGERWSDNPFVFALTFEVKKL